MIKKLDAVDVARKGLKMDRETLINEFLDRAERWCASFDRVEMRKALDRLFADLRDFTGEIYGERRFTVTDDPRSKRRARNKKRSRTKWVDQKDNVIQNRVHAEQKTNLCRHRKN